MVRLRMVGLLLPLLLVISGCPQGQVQVTIRDAIVGAKTTTDSLKLKYACSAPTTVNTATCAKITKVVAAKDLAIDALETYCAGPAFESGGACTPSADPTTAKNAQIKVQAALTALQQYLLDIKGL